MVPLSYYLGLSAVLFCLGVLGFLLKRNIVTIFMSIELMLNAVNLTFVAFAAHLKNLDGQIFVFFVMVVAAAEAAVGLAIIIAVFRTRETLNVDRVNLLQASVPYIETHLPWIEAGGFVAPFGFYLDQLSLVMILVVTGVGFIIHLYSVGYMEHEGGYYRFFAYLNLFMFFMLTLVLANNYLLMFVGWEGVGL